MNKNLINVKKKQTDSSNNFDEVLRKFWKYSNFGKMLILKGNFVKLLKVKESFEVMYKTICENYTKNCVGNFE